MNKWIRRKRNSHGFGVQSPNDFYFVKHVLREDSPYYAYREMRKMTKALRADLPHCQEEVCRLLFRLVNYVHPEVILEVGTGSGNAACSMALARVFGRCITIDTSNAHSEEIASVCSRLPQIEFLKGDVLSLFKKTVQEEGKVEFLHVSHTSEYKEVVSCAIPFVGDKALFVIQGICDSAEKRTWWNELRESLHAVVCYDLGTIGLLYFDKTRYKTTYWVDLKK